jgi:hypothetical protein
MDRVSIVSRLWRYVDCRLQIPADCEPQRWRGYLLLNRSWCKPQVATVRIFRRLARCDAREDGDTVVEGDIRIPAELTTAVFRMTRAPVHAHDVVGSGGAVPDLWIASERASRGAKVGTRGHAPGHESVWLPWRQHHSGLGAQGRRSRCRIKMWRWNLPAGGPPPHARTGQQPRQCLTGQPCFGGGFGQQPAGAVSLPVSLKAQRGRGGCGPWKVQLRTLWLHPFSSEPLLVRAFWRSSWGGVGGSTHQPLALLL